MACAGAGATSVDATLLPFGKSWVRVLWESGCGWGSIWEVFADALYCGLCAHRSCPSQRSDWSGFGHSGDVPSAGSTESTEEQLNCVLCSVHRLARGRPCATGRPTFPDGSPQHSNTSLGSGAGRRSPASSMSSSRSSRNMVVVASRSRLLSWTLQGPGTGVAGLMRPRRWLGPGRYLAGSGARSSHSALAPAKGEPGERLRGRTPVCSPDSSPRRDPADRSGHPPPPHMEASAFTQVSKTPQEPHNFLCTAPHC